MSSQSLTPCFVMSEEKLTKNLAKIALLEEKSGVKILHTVKSFNKATVLPLISSKLSGMSTSSLSEVKMAQKANSEHIHLYTPAYKKNQLEILLDEVDTLSFNSLNQWYEFSTLKGKASKGLRINPMLHLPMPDYCNPNLECSRLGVNYREFLEAYTSRKENFSDLEGLHFHALFQSSLRGVEILLEHIIENYGAILPQIKWLNLGGGHNFTDNAYELDAFVSTMERFNLLYPHLELYFEPGESVVKGCGDFITTVLDIVEVLGEKVVILDTSIETHLLDVAIVNQRLKVKGTQAFSTPYFYELTGNSCLQGDIIGQYFFLEALNIGDKVIFEDMMGYTMVKMTEFNGMEKAEFILK